MKLGDQYHKWVEWSEEDQTYLGRCPDLITGIHGDDPVQLYSELCDVVDEVVEHFEDAGRVLPPARIRPMPPPAATATSFAQAGEIRQNEAPYDDGSPEES